MAEEVKDEGRRKFLGGLAATLGGAFALLGAAKLPAAAAHELPPVSEGVIYPDPALCVGCGACEVSCGQVHEAAGLSGVPRIHIMIKDGATVGVQQLRTVDIESVVRRDRPSYAVPDQGQ